MNLSGECNYTLTTPLVWKTVILRYNEPTITILHYGISVFSSLFSLSSLFLYLRVMAEKGITCLASYIMSSYMVSE